MNDAELLARRRTALAPAYQLFYDDPVHLVRGSGVWVDDVDGTRYLDCYNNVPSVGHCHPRVVDALTRQAALLNTNTRYLHEHVVELAERLGASLAGDLGVCFFVCTGTEANDLAVEIARVVTGAHGVLVSERSYHGNSSLVSLLSTDSYPADDRPGWLGVVEPPNTYRGPYRFGEHDDLAGQIRCVRRRRDQAAGGERSPAGNDAVRHELGLQRSPHRARRVRRAGGGDRTGCGRPRDR